MPGTVHLDILKHIQIASPCSEPWEDMVGDNRIRHCQQCDLDVHNLAEMTRVEIEQLVLGADGRVCGRIYRRFDNTILTRDCPVGLAALRAKARRTAARAVALVAFLCSAGVVFATERRDDWFKSKLSGYQPFKWADEVLGPSRGGFGGGFTGGVMAYPMPPTPPAPTPPYVAPNGKVVVAPWQELPVFREPK